MGDVAMTVPVLRAFSEQYPDVKVTVLTRAFFTPFFRDIPNVNVYHAELKGKHKSIFGLYQLSKELKTLKINAVADLHNVLRSKVLKCFFSGIKVIQIDKGRTEKKALVTGKTFQQLKTTHQRYADVFEALGFPINLSNPSFPPKAILNQKLIEIIGVTDKKRIAIAPFAAHASKMYPLHLMEQVIESLSKNHQILLFGGGKNESEILSKLEEKFQNVINLASKLTLNEELDVISNCDVMLSMDSGNAHIAAMLGIKVVTLWGVTHPYAGFYPFHQDESNALLSDRNLYPKIPTSVYGNKFPEEYKNSMKTILPQTVINKIESLI
uniref:glycosyltransferase family 9 protein n=1 Tax=Gelidibacter sp. TaxID=2018083 RepID=UPI00404A7BE9